MGGGAAGRTASELTVTALVEGYFDGASDNPLANLQDGVNAANSAVAVFASNAG